MHIREIIAGGKPLEEAAKALIMLHGRGATAKDILPLSDAFDLKDFTIIAPQATNKIWYPNSFLSPPRQNEPWLSSALQIIASIEIDLNDHGIQSGDIYLFGFSQGACLALEYATRNAKLYGGIAALSGGLIGDVLYYGNYKGNFRNTPVYIGCSDPDPHIPLERVNITAGLMKKMHANVKVDIYREMGHTIIEDEINTVNQMIFS